MKTLTESRKKELGELIAENASTYIEELQTKTYNKSDLVDVLNMNTDAIKLNSKEFFNSEEEFDLVFNSNDNEALDDIFIYASIELSDINS